MGISLCLVWFNSAFYKCTNLLNISHDKTNNILFKYKYRVFGSRPGSPTGWTEPGRTLYFFKACGLASLAGRPSEPMADGPSKPRTGELDGPG